MLPNPGVMVIPPHLPQETTFVDSSGYDLFTAQALNNRLMTLELQSTPSNSDIVELQTQINLLKDDIIQLTEITRALHKKLEDIEMDKLI